jgi:hypothetical protein
MKHVWVRAIVAPLVYLPFLVGLTEVGGAAQDDGHRAIGDPVLIFAALSLFVAVMIVPAWILQPRTPSPGGRPPRGRILPFPVCRPAQHDHVADTSYRSAA